MTNGLLSAFEVDPGSVGNGTLLQSGGQLTASYISIGRNTGSVGNYASPAARQRSDPTCTSVSSPPAPQPTPAER